MKAFLKVIMRLPSMVKVHMNKVEEVSDYGNRDTHSDYFRVLLYLKKEHLTRNRHKNQFRLRI